MKRKQIRPDTRRLMRLAGICVLTLAACSQGYVEEPWTGQDPQWKQSHFASPTPAAELSARAVLTQIDR